jgi:DNA-binding NarL/FixJ family response regulator
MVKKKIIVIDDEPLIATLMKELVDEDPALEISKITTTKEEFLNAITQEIFDIALIDISVGGREGGIEILRYIKNKNMSMPVIVLSAHDERLYALECLKAGAKGYISKECICAQVITGLKEVLDGNLFVSGDRGKSIVEQYKKLKGTQVSAL